MKAAVLTHVSPERGRFRRVTMWCMNGLSAAAVIVAAGWWWLSWPERTVRTFLDLVADGRLDKAQQLLVPPQEWKTRDPAASLRETDDCKLEAKPRKIADLLAARGDFRLVRWGEWASGGMVIRVQRGRIQLESYLSGRGKPSDWE